MVDFADRQSKSVLADLVAAFSEPGAVNPAFAAHVLDQAEDLLAAAESREDGQHRMPTLMFPRSAVVDVPDEPPLPPAAL